MKQERVDLIRKRAVSLQAYSSNRVSCLYGNIHRLNLISADSLNQVIITQQPYTMAIPKAESIWCQRVKISRIVIG